MLFTLSRVGVVSLFLSLRVDRMYDQHLSWNDKLAENDSAEYQQLEFEAGKAVSIFYLDSNTTPLEHLPSINLAYYYRSILPYR